MRERLGRHRGVLGLRCDGHERQYVAYLAALQAGHPVALMSADQDPAKAGLTLHRLYNPAHDALEERSAPPQKPTGAGAGPPLHPELAALLSTSGTTGSTKWVRLSYANVAANAASIAEYLALDETDCAPMSLPFQYSYGMSVLNSHLAVGGTLLLSEGSVSETGFWDRFREAGCTGFAGVPHSFDLMERVGVSTGDLPDLRRMTQAGGKLPATKVAEWVARATSEGWDFVVMYGQTEAAPRIAYLPPALARQTPGAVGLAVPGGTITVEEDGAALPDGEVGEIVYRGPNVMMGYARRDADLAGGQGPAVLNTGDLGRRLDNGAVEITGRRSRFMKFFGLRVGLDEVEARLAEAGHVVAAGSRDDVLCLLLEQGEGAGDDDARAVEAELARWLGLPASSVKAFVVENLPRRANGKVDGPAVGHEIERRLAQDAPPPAAAAGPDRPGAAAIMARHLNRDGIGPEDTFRDLGGDSLSYLSVAMELETRIGRLPEHWQDMTVAELDALAASRPASPGGGARGDLLGRLTGHGGPLALTTLDVPTALRALSISLVAAGHVDFLNYGGGGTFTLLVLVGWSLGAFTLPTVAATRSTRPFVSLGIRVALLALILSALNFAVTGYGSLQGFTFVSNWIAPEMPGAAWFVDIYIQLVILLALALMPLLGSERVHAVLSSGGAGTMLGATAAAIAVMAVSETIWDTNDVFRRLPHLLAWLLILGIAIQRARTVLDRALASALLLAGVAIFRQGLPDPNYQVIAGLVLIWVPAVPVPRIVATTFRIVAAASLTIYLLHLPIPNAVERFIDLSPAAEWAVGIAAGVVAWQFWRPIDAFIAKLFSKKNVRLQNV